MCSGRSAPRRNLPLPCGTSRSRARGGPIEDRELEAQAWRARRALARGDFEVAVDTLDVLRAGAPASVQALGVEAELALRRDDPAAADLCARLAELFPDSARARYLAGRALAEARDWHGALAQLDEAERLASSWLIRRWRAKALTNCGRGTDAEPILRELMVDRPFVAFDLAWVHERAGRHAEALAVLDGHAEHLDPAHLAVVRERLQSALLEPGLLAEEVETLAALGEEVADEAFANALGALLDTGRIPAARELVAGRLARLPPRRAIDAGFAAYKRQAWDLALDLLLAGLPSRPTYLPALKAIETAARRCARGPSAAARLRALAEAGHPKLWGWARRLERLDASSG